MNRRRSLWYCLTFYRQFMLLSGLILFCGIFLSLEYGTSIFVGVFWLKVLTTSLTVYFINTNRSARFYYYHNLGMTKRFLWTATILFDGLFYFLCIILTNHLR